MKIIENFYKKTKEGFILLELSINYKEKTYIVGELMKRKSEMVCEKIKELRRLGFKEEKDV